MTSIRPVSGSTANCTLLPPVVTPISRMIAIEASRMRWYSLSVSVIAGATVIESPVCTPIGSRFSIEHTITALSLASRTTSSSNSFQPSTDSSTRIECTGETSRPNCTMRSKSGRLYAMPPPEPPSVKLGRKIAGKPISSTIARASSTEVTRRERGQDRPMRAIACLNSSRSSAISIDLIDAPSSSVPCFSSRPAFAAAIARLRPVWPPSVGKIAVGFSRASTRSSTSTVSGSTYVASASSGSVMIVAGFELMRMTRRPSSRSALHACVPE